MRFSQQCNSFLLALCGLFLITTAAALLEPYEAQSRMPQRTSVPEHNAAPIMERDIGICKTYITQGGDTCKSIAKAHGLSMFQLTLFNFYSWRFNCANLPQGSIICIGPGAPPMPTPRSGLTCGPLVPGTLRPANWSDLGSLNPCPANKCCAGDGTCESPGDRWCAPQDNTCMSNCQKASTTTAKTSTTSTLQTTTKPKPTTTTTTTTTTSAGPAWTLIAYTGAICNDDYYLLRGHKDQDSCIDLPGDYKAGYDDPTGIYCKYFTDGGFTSSSCASAPASPQLLSWSLTGGVCTAYDASCSEGGGMAISIDPQTGCQEDVMARHTRMQWRSIRCQVN